MLTLAKEPILQSGRLAHPVRPGEAIRYWRLSDIREERFDVADRPMEGGMDAMFFLTSHKNFIPHEYPCRTEFAARHRNRRPEPAMDFSASRWWLPFGSDRVDLSGFWFRPTRISAWANAIVTASETGLARLRLATCGGAVLFLGGREIGYSAAYVRNMENAVEFDVELEAGDNEIRIYFDDLAERDTRFYFQLDYLSGPAVTASVPVPLASSLAEVIERLLAGMHFERTAYFAGQVAIVLPEPAPANLGVNVTIEGDFMSTEEEVRLDFHLPAGARRLVIGNAEDLPADFRHFRIALQCGDFSVACVLGAEICHVERQGQAPADLASRIGEALDHVAERSESDSVRVIARLALGRGGSETDAMIEAVLPMIEDCHDCADFVLVPLLWSRIAWPDAIGTDLRDRIDEEILGFRYWLDEPGNDVQWYFSENHALLFHTAGYLAGHLLPEATFRRSGRNGRDQSAVNLARVRAWLDHFERWGMAEWNSAPYFPIDLKGLTALAALAPDADVRERAAKGIVQLVEIVARSCHHGMITAAQGRSYEHTLRPGRSLELSGIARLLWGMGWYGRRFHALPQLAVCLRDHGLEIPSHLGPLASLEGEAAQEWCFSQGENHFGKLYHYKTAHFALGSVAAYRPGSWGYQETVLHLRIGTRPESQVWINHPGETIQSGYGRPSYWGGCGTLPRVHQYRALAVLDFDIHEGQPDFTHAWLAREAFDEVEVTANIVAARSGAGLLLLIGSGAFEEVQTGPTTGNEIRLPGSKTRWIVRLSHTGKEGSLAAFRQRFAGLAVEQAEESLVVNDPDYGAVTCRSDGIVVAEGRILVPGKWTTGGEARVLAVSAEAP